MSTLPSLYLCICIRRLAITGLAWRDAVGTAFLLPGPAYALADRPLRLRLVISGKALAEEEPRKPPAPAEGRDRTHSRLLAVRERTGTWDRWMADRRMDG